MVRDVARVKSIFLAAVERYPAEQWPAYLDEACGEDTALRERVEELLGAHGGQKSLDVPAPSQPGATVDQPLVERPGTVIGPYKLLEQIGEGGMGVVYMAEQTQPVRRKVALKVIKPGMDTKQVIARFEAERQALALMDHPNIAKVLDAGATESGRPYFVMELVRGIPITEYCDREQLSIPRAAGAVRAGLPGRAARPPEGDHPPRPEALEHPGDAPRRRAGAQGHRLRRRQGHRRRASPSKTLFTGFAQLVGTPLYMSPEQAELSGLDVDTRSDIYSPGRAALRAADRDDAVRPGDAPQGGLRRDAADHPRGGAAAAEHAAEHARRDAHDRLGQPRGRPAAAGPVGARRAGLDRDEGAGEGPAAAVRDGQRLRGRRDAVPDRPAGGGVPAVGRLSAAEVRAAEQRAGGRGSGAGRAPGAGDGGHVHRAGVGVASGTHGDPGEGAERDQRAETKAKEEAAIATAVNDFLRNDLLAEAAPDKNARAKKVTVEEVLGRAAARIAGKFAQQPRVEAAIRQTIGDTYRALGDYPAAQPHLERAWELGRRVLGEEHPDTLDVHEQPGGAVPWTRASSPRPSRSSSRRWKSAAASWGRSTPTRSTSMNNLAMLYQDQGQFAQAEPLLVKALEVSRRVLGEEHPDTLTAMNNLAVLYLDQGKFAKAEPLLVKALEVRRRVLGEEHPDTLSCHEQPGGAVLDQGKFAKAEPLLVKALEVRRRVLGESTPTRSSP